MSELYKAIAGSPITYLAADISANQTTISIVDDSALPDAPNICTIGYGENIETIRYGAKSNGVLQNVTRGIEGTPRAWSAGTEVARFFTAYDHNSIIENFNSHLAESANKAHGGFKGALINMPYGISYSIPNDTLTALQFKEVQYDTGNIYNSLEPRRLTVPQGVSKVKVSANVVFSFASTGTRELAIYKNGSGFRGTPRANMQAPIDSALSMLNVASGVLEVNGGDYFEVYVRQTSGSALSVTTSNTTRVNSIWFALEVIE